MPERMHNGPGKTGPRVAESRSDPLETPIRCARHESYYSSRPVLKVRVYSKGDASWEPPGAQAASGKGEGRKGRPIHPTRLECGALAKRVFRPGRLISCRSSYA